MDDDMIPFVPEDEIVSGFSATDDDDDATAPVDSDTAEETESLEVLRKKELEEDEEGLDYFLPDAEE